MNDYMSTSGLSSLGQGPGSAPSSRNTSDADLSQNCVPSSPPDASVPSAEQPAALPHPRASAHVVSSGGSLMLVLNCTVATLLSSAVFGLPEKLGTEDFKVPPRSATPAVTAAEGH